MLGAIGPLLIEAQDCGCIGANGHHLSDFAVLWVDDDHFAFTELRGDLWQRRFADERTLYPHLRSGRAVDQDGAGLGSFDSSSTEHDPDQKTGRDGPPEDYLSYSRGSARDRRWRVRLVLAFRRVPETVVVLVGCLGAVAGRVGCRGVVNDRIVCFGHRRGDGRLHGRRREADDPFLHDGGLADPVKFRLQGRGGHRLGLFGRCVLELSHLCGDVGQLLLPALVVFASELDQFDGQSLLCVGADACDLRS